MPSNIEKKTDQNFEKIQWIQKEKNESQMVPFRLKESVKTIKSLHLFLLHRIYIALIFSSLLICNNKNSSSCNRIALFMFHKSNLKKNIYLKTKITR